MGFIGIYGVTRVYRLYKVYKGAYYILFKSIIRFICRVYRGLRATWGCMSGLHGMPEKRLYIP